MTIFSQRSKPQKMEFRCGYIGLKNGDLVPVPPDDLQESTEPIPRNPASFTTSSLESKALESLVRRSNGKSWLIRFSERFSGKDSES